jgi:anaerobic C4-dicarboxylate transporter
MLKKTIVLIIAVVFLTAVCAPDQAQAFAILFPAVGLAVVVGVLAAVGGISAVTDTHRYYRLQGEAESGPPIDQRSPETTAQVAGSR